MRFLYELLMSWAVWLALVPLEIARGATAAKMRERLALTPPEPPGAVLLHAVSLGELAAAETLIRALAPREVVLSVGTDDARKRAASLLGELPNLRAARYLPWDRRRAIERWLRSSRFVAIAIVETEIWPGLFLAARSSGTPLCMVSGRLYPKDVFRYRLARRFFKRVLSCASWIGAQNETEAGRFIAIGASRETLDVAGNLKWDLPLVPRRESGLTVIGANTHPGEEALIRDALRESSSSAALILAPRHVSRAAEVRAIAGAAQVVDRVGALADLYPTASVSILGGTFVPRGGHSPIEAAAAGCPVVCGPHTEHVEELIAPLRERGALLQLHSPRELSSTLSVLLADPERRAEMSASAAEVVRENQGAARRCAAKIAELAEAQRFTKTTETSSA